MGRRKSLAILCGDNRLRGHMRCICRLGANLLRDDGGTCEAPTVSASLERAALPFCNAPAHAYAKRRRVGLREDLTPTSRR